MTNQTKEYEVTEERFIAGQHRVVGAIIPMSVQGAKYYVQPHGSGLKRSAAQVAKDVAAEKNEQAAQEDNSSDKAAFVQPVKANKMAAEVPAKDKPGK